MGNRISVLSRAVAAAGDYAAADIVSNSATADAGTAWTFPNTGRQGVIYDAVCSCSEDSVVWRLRLHLFTKTPTTSEMDDNAAKAFTEVDRANLLGYIDFQAAGDQGAYSVAGGSALNKGYFAPSGQLFGVLETLDAETGETAGMSIEFKLFIRQDN